MSFHGVRQSKKLRSASSQFNLMISRYMFPLISAPESF